MSTRFRIGSMNMMFTAVAVLQLRERGKLSLHDTLAQWLPDYPNAELAKSVTLHHLLTHTGGTGDIFGPLFGQHRQELTSHQAYIDLYGKRALEFTPGERFAYSNYGFVLLGCVIEKASGQSYYDYVRQHVYGPAKMTATGSEPESERPAELSVGYRRGPDGLKPNVDTLPPRGTAAGGGYSTAEDLPHPRPRWRRARHERGACASARLRSRAGRARQPGPARRRRVGQLHHRAPAAREERARRRTASATGVPPGDRATLAWREGAQRAIALRSFRR